MKYKNTITYNSMTAILILYSIVLLVVATKGESIFETMVDMV